MTPDRHYVCARCDGVFISGWPEKNAIAEYQAMFPEHRDEPKIVLCEDCYLVFLKWLNVPQH